MGHITDLMATCLAVAGAKYPATNSRGQKVQPLRGRSLAPIFRGEKRQATDTVFFHFSSNRAVRSGKWKLSWAGKGPWELYNMDKDRTELVDLSGKFPARAKEMAASWEQWFKATSGGAFKGRKRKGNQANKNKKDNKKKSPQGE
jgi:arylsulfatase